VGAGFAVFRVTPPLDFDYSGTKIQWAEVNTEVYGEAGPEDVNDLIVVSGLDAERIYTFVPYAYDVSNNIGKPGNVLLATAPINVISMDQLKLNSQGLYCIWKMINRKVDKQELTTTLNRMTDAVRGMITDKGFFDARLEILEREIAILRRKLGS
jgi:hypothetical protein